MIQSLIESFKPEEHLLVWLFGAFLWALLTAWQTFPTVNFVAREKKLLDEPDSRSLHSKSTPTLGGIGIFVGVMVVIAITGAFLNTKILLLVLGGLSVLFFLGLKDDLLVLSPRKKLLGQLFAAGLLVVFADLRIRGFSGIMGVTSLPYWVSICFTLFVYVLIINAYNLIDGVDGLAGSIALSVSAVFVYIFVKIGNVSLATIAIALCGSLIAFLRFNFSRQRKIFMGDTGSLVVGFLLAVFTISFINQVQIQPELDYHSSSPALAFAMLFYPMIDTLRIFLIRIVIHKTSPFKADKNHIHHQFIRAGFGHKTTTFLITGINLMIIAIAFNMLHLHLNHQILYLLIYGSLFYALPFAIKKIFN